MRAPDFVALTVNVLISPTDVTKIITAAMEVTNGTVVCIIYN